jgi:hypothetical protein
LKIQRSDYLHCRQAGFSEKSLKNSNSSKKDQDTFIPYADKLWLASGCVLATALQNAGINSATVKEALFKTGNPFFRGTNFVVFPTENLARFY